MVARFNHRPGSGCWWCFQAALEHSIPLSAEDPVATVQPAGCNRITYVGANFDLMEIALQGVRLAVATLLSRQAPSTDSDFPWDVAIVNLRDADRRRIPPHWTTYVLEQNPNCPVCGQ
jgi:hypothetical protein